MTDDADNEVKGIDRYLPAGLPKAILLLIPGTVWLVFTGVRGHPDWFGMSTFSPLEQTLCALLIASAICITMLAVLVLHMAIALNHSKHRRIVQYTTEYPLMSFKFLAKNAGRPNWLALGFTCAAFFVVGYFFRNF